MVADLVEGVDQDHDLVVFVFPKEARGRVDERHVLKIADFQAPRFDDQLIRPEANEPALDTHDLLLNAEDIPVEGRGQNAFNLSADGFAAPFHPTDALLDVDPDPLFGEEVRVQGSQLVADPKQEGLGVDTAQGSALVAADEEDGPVGVVVSQLGKKVLLPAPGSAVRKRKRQSGFWRRASTSSASQSRRRKRGLSTT